MTGEIIAAATALLVRDGASGLEVLMATRARTIEFAAGAAVFPGGKVDAADRRADWRALSSGADHLSEDDMAFRIAGIRETFEETGLLLAHDRTGAPVDPARVSALGARRAEVECTPALFLELVGAADLLLDAGAFADFAHWLTPDMMPKRYDTRFLIARAPANQVPHCDGGEATALDWLSPAAAAAEARAGVRSIMFPTRVNLELLGEAGSVAEAIAAANARPLRPVTPQLVKENGESILLIRDDAGYATLREPLSVHIR
jgi:8-oxo-dGTP pyrophosphatase MutT (NUDIX family)